VIFRIKRRHDVAEDRTLIELTSEIVGAYVLANSIAANDLPGLIHGVHKALSGAGQPEAAPEEAEIKATASQVRKSLSPEALVSFEDGKSYKSLKRHLSTRGMTPDEYRAKWGLPKDYPMVAPNYSAQRSALAKTLGLGRKAAPAPTPAAAPEKRGRGRPRIAQAEQTQQAQRSVNPVHAEAETASDA
jgi:predicted transcriptional regulator